jgi:hypothetical protein
MTEDENIELITEELIEDIEEVSTEVEVEEQNLDEIIVTEEDENIELIEDATESTMEEVVVEVDVEEEEPVEIIVTEAADPTGVRITSDHSPYLPDQHTVGAITGLTERLEKLERFEHPDTVPLPEPVEAVETNQANYYLWDDENPHAENRDGYFVSIHQKQDVNKIYICNSLEDEFGVTVSAAGFIGNQSTNTRGSNYGLVVHSGVVAVKCESDVGVGDYVVSNKFGQAKKTDGTYGYLVHSKSTIGNDENYAIISLTTNSKPLQKVSKVAQDVAERMDSAEVNIATAISVANAAYNKAQVSQDWVQGSVENIAGQVGNVSGIVDSVVGDVTKLGDETATATEEALKAQNAAATTLKETQSLNNSMHSNLASLVKHLDPDSTWIDPATGENWDTYFVNYIEKGNIPTSSTIKTLDGKLTQNEAETSHNATQIKQIVTSTDVYSIGEWSQAYGLSLAEAWNILKVGMVYIPTTALHAEKYEYETIESWGEDKEEIEKRDTNLIYRTADDKRYWRYLPAAPDGTLTYEWSSMPLNDINGEHYIIDEEEEFTRGYFYIWNGYYWVESDNPVVIFSGTYVNNAAGKYLYWYMDAPEDLTITNSDTTVTYRARSLYKWEFGEWVEVNTLSGNITNRATSSFIQTATEIAANVTSARLMAHMGVKVTKDGAYVDSQASAVTPLLKDGQTITLDDQYIIEDEAVLSSVSALSGQYCAVGSIAPYDIYMYDGNNWIHKPLLYYDDSYVMKINTAGILLSANEEIAQIDLNGPAIFTSNDNGTVTGINGSCITTGTITDLKNTMRIDLDNGAMTLTGDAYITGRINATSGYIGDKNNGFTIDVHDSSSLSGSGCYYLSNKQTYLGTDASLDEGGVYISPLGIGLGNGNFYVDNLGNLTTYGNISLYNKNKILSMKVDENGLTTGGNITLGGSITLDGNMILRNGSISWNSANSPVLVLYSKSTTGFPTNKTAYDSTDDKTTTWHRIYQSGDKYAVYSYDGGNTWSSSAIQIAARDGVDGNDGKDANRVSYIKETYIDKTTMLSPGIFGGIFLASGIGSSTNPYDNAAYYISNGMTSSVDANTGKLSVTFTPAGYISYDTNGAGTSAEAKNRVLFTTLNNAALKIQSSGDMSLSADTIWMMSDVQFDEDVTVDFNGCNVKGLPSTSTTTTAVFA